MIYDSIIVEVIQPGGDDTTMSEANPKPEAGSSTARDQVQVLMDYMNNHILGQQELVTRMLIALLADGHLLVEGAPGLAKTRAVKTLAAGLEGDFKRIQFTPDLLPSDLTGTGRISTAGRQL